MLCSFFFFFWLGCGHISCVLMSSIFLFAGICFMSNELVIPTIYYPFCGCLSNWGSMHDRDHFAQRKQYWLEMFS